ncbi:transglycosylase domain-containing protein [Pseudomonas gingeri]|uniref:transglycosylase domain-containing protein n=1 Tax=Pseudomonas gingeri TaxID=117681 RepID=UPI0015A003BB|nr:transglycosylase domain-containing protein [Pseudomonas gingeri]NWE50451.1 transglycosylase domain-containing protein [Pseudomonas gingeri]
MDLYVIRYLNEKADTISKEILYIDSLLGGKRLMPSLSCQKMLILAEDKRAWRHCGFDVLAILRSIVLTLSGRPHGGSTILQQLIRTITCRYERTLRRKFSEILLAYLVAGRVDRSIYPRVYLSIAHYGTGMESYDKLVGKLKISSEDNLRSAAMAVARLKYPEPRNASPVKRALISRRENFLLEKYGQLKNTRIFSHVETI